MVRWLLCLCILMSLNGCGIKEIDELGFVVAIGFDQSEKDERKLKVSVKVAIPKGDPADGKVEFVIITQESASIATALQYAKSKVEKELNYGHAKVIILGEQLVKDEVNSIIDWAIKRRDIQKISYIAVGVPDAKSILAANPKSERVPSDALFTAFAKEGTQSPFVVTTHLFDMKRKLTESGWDPIVPVVEKAGEKLVIQRSAVFDKHHLVKMLSPDEIRLFNLLTHRNLNTSFSITHAGEVFAIHLVHSRASYKIFSDNAERPFIQYSLTINAIIEENVREAEITKLTPQEVGEMIGDHLKVEIKSLLHTFQKQNVDPIGFGLHYGATHWNNQTEMKEWEEIYPNIDFQIQTKINMFSR